MKPHYGCPVKATANALAGKWKVMIVWHLSFGQLRFAEVRDLLPRVSDKVLAEHLRELEADGIVRRTALPTVPPHVNYELTNAGRDLIPIMQTMCEWAGTYLGVTPNFPQAAPVSPSAARS